MPGKLDNGEVEVELVWSNGLTGVDDTPCPHSPVGLQLSTGHPAPGTSSNGNSASVANLRGGDSRTRLSRYEDSKAGFDPNTYTHTYFNLYA